MKNNLSPFTLGKDSLWHWRNECADFPTEKNARVLVSIHFPQDIELCPKCNEIYTNEASKKRMTMSGNTASSIMNERMNDRLQMEKALFKY